MAKATEMYFLAVLEAGIMVPIDLVPGSLFLTYVAFLVCPPMAKGEKETASSLGSLLIRALIPS